MDSRERIAAPEQAAFMLTRRHGVRSRGNLVTGRRQVVSPRTRWHARGVARLVPREEARSASWVDPRG